MNWQETSTAKAVRQAPRASPGVGKPPGGRPRPDTGPGRQTRRAEEPPQGADKHSPPQARGLGQTLALVFVQGTFQNSCFWGSTIFLENPRGPTPGVRNRTGGAGGVDPRGDRSWQ